MKISDAIQCIKSQYRQDSDKRLSLFLQGAPGIGKSDSPKAAAVELTAELPDPDRLGPVQYMALQATIEDPITLSGLPVRDADGEHAVFLHFRDKLPTSGRGILEIAEINTAPPAVQAGFYRLFLEGRLGSYTLPPGWYVIATGNRDEDRAATQRIPMPLIGRWCRLEVTADLADWTRWALGNGIRTEMVAFYQFRPENFMTFDPAKAEPYSSPRTAVFASRILDSAPAGLEHEMLSGTIGQGVATELTAFLKIWRTMVSAAEILLNPAGARVPTDPDTLYAVCGALADKMTPNVMEPAMTYINRMPTEFQVLTARLATQRDPKLCTTRPFIEWVSRNTDVVL